MSLPRVSVVLAAHGSSIHLIDSVESILSQSFDDFECIVVCDGRLALPSFQDLKRLAYRDSRIRILEQEASGLTAALILGCSAAHGLLIARLDVGDRMQPSRLESQFEIMSHYNTCVLATSDVRVCGPSWEYLRIDSQPSSRNVPVFVDRISPERGIDFDVPHHASVIFRRDAYYRAGGYRRQFYFGQDWDLWYRLARIGPFVHQAEVLTSVRLFPQGLSSRFYREQQRIAEISLACYVARRAGLSDSLLLTKAFAIRPQISGSARFSSAFKRSDGFYFIGESLRRNADKRSITYLLMALRLGFWRPRTWIRFFQALFI